MGGDPMYGYSCNMNVECPCDNGQGFISPNCPDTQLCMSCYVGYTKVDNEEEGSISCVAENNEPSEDEGSENECGCANGFPIMSSNCPVESACKECEAGFYLKGGDYKYCMPEEASDMDMMYNNCDEGGWVKCSDLPEKNNEGSENECGCANGFPIMSSNCPYESACQECEAGFYLKGVNHKYCMPEEASDIDMMYNNCDEPGWVKCSDLPENEASGSWNP